MKPLLYRVLPLLVALTLAAQGAAHGWVGSISIAGTTYQGPPLGTSGPSSVIRQVNTNSPVTSVSDPNLACGPNALEPAQDIASANPGDAIDVYWVSTAGAWFHDVGPMLTYLTNCGSSSPCSQFDTSGAIWFKIQQVGRNAAGWAQAEMNNGAPANLSLPSNLAAGNYIMRHEIIALQNGVSQGGAEFYASCSQLQVGGSGTGAPTSDELVKIPGAYSATDPGILVDVYSNPNAAYTFPGPPIAAFVSGGGSAPPPTNPPGTSGSPSRPTTSPGQPMSPPGGGSPTSTGSRPSSTSCRLQRTILSSRSVPAAATSRRRWHRVLQDLPLFRK
ncbi:glycoside hydrolase family 61 protein [Mycena alexandri]|uniref:lytic cellulose monooxygenase (C4-dehydrogenating) n=1 Tax=Mycena alexandri TaxID=1745969 RepID=A0AAD6TCP9_9AGAR|nr:glycoside hydrolase family 61 protein [Mycena alexandri]